MVREALIVLVHNASPPGYPVVDAPAEDVHVFRNGVTMRWVEIDKLAPGIAQPRESSALTFMERGSVLLCSPSAEDDELSADRRWSAVKAFA
jgi:hypothetical protein